MNRPPDYLRLRIGPLRWFSAKRPIRAMTHEFSAAWKMSYKPSNKKAVIAYRSNACLSCKWVQTRPAPQNFGIYRNLSLPLMVNKTSFFYVIRAEHEHTDRSLNFQLSKLFLVRNLRTAYLYGCRVWPRYARGVLVCVNTWVVCVCGTLCGGGFKAEVKLDCGQSMLKVYVKNLYPLLGFSKVNVRL